MNDQTENYDKRMSIKRARLQSMKSELTGVKAMCEERFLRRKAEIELDREISETKIQLEYYRSQYYASDHDANVVRPTTENELTCRLSSASAPTPGRFSHSPSPTPPGSDAALAEKFAFADWREGPRRQSSNQLADQIGAAMGLLSHPQANRLSVPRLNLGQDLSVCSSARRPTMDSAVATGPLAVPKMSFATKHTTGQDAPAGTGQILQFAPLDNVVHKPSQATSLSVLPPKLQPLNQINLTHSGTSLASYEKCGSKRNVSPDMVKTNASKAPRYEAVSLSSAPSLDSDQLAFYQPASLEPYQSPHKLSVKVRELFADQVKELRQEFKDRRRRTSINKDGWNTPPKTEENRVCLRARASRVKCVLSDRPVQACLFCIGKNQLCIQSQKGVNKPFAAPLPLELREYLSPNDTSYWVIEI